MGWSNKKLAAGVFMTLICFISVLLGASLRYISFKNNQEKLAQGELAQGKKAALKTAQAEKVVAQPTQAEELVSQRAVVPAITAECDNLRYSMSQTEYFVESFESEAEIFNQKAAQVKSLNDIKLAASEYNTETAKLIVDLDKVLNGLQAKSITDETLDQIRDGYAEVVQGFSVSVQEARQAMELIVSAESEAKLPALVERSQQQTRIAISPIDGFSKREAELNFDINMYCKNANSQYSEPVK